jgi:hypothetical protein
VNHTPAASDPEKDKAFELGDTISYAYRLLDDDKCP